MDADANDALMITITAIPGQGTLKYYNGTAWETVMPNKVIPYEAVKNGLLVYIPVTGDTGNEAFSYTVSDGVFTTPLATVTFSINIELSVSSPLPVDEGKATVFVVELSDIRAVSTVMTLTLGGEANSSDYVAPMEYRIQNADGSYTAWQTVTSGQITLDAGKTKAEVKVKTVVNDDGLDVVSETLTLTATTTAAADLANTSATGQTSINDLPSLLVSGASYVSEGGSTFFALELSAIKATDTLVTLSFEGVATPGALADYEYSLDGGTSWISLATTTVTIPGNALSNPTLEILVRTRADAVVESDEVLRLVATTYDAGIANSNTEVTASTLIVDPIVVSTNEDTAITILSGASYDYAQLGAAAHGTVSSVGGNITYTPNLNWSGTDSFTITKTNEVGLSVTSVVTVNVAADADAPTVSISAGSAVYNNDAAAMLQLVDNGTFDADVSLWTLSANTGVQSVQYSSGMMQMSAKGSGKIATASQVIEAVSGQVYTLTINLSSTAGFSATYGTQTVAPPGGWVVGNNTLTVSGGATAAANTLTLIVAGSGSNTTNTVNVDNVSMYAPAFGGSYTYNVNIDAALVDTDGSETLQYITVTATDGDGAGVAQSLPSGAVLKYSNGDLVTVLGTNSWSVDPARTAGLRLVVNKPVLASSFTLTANGTSIELSNSDVSTGTADSEIISVPLIASSTSNPVPTIADAVATLSNAQQTQNILTSFGDGTNTFSWLTVVDSLPKIYANGEVVQYSVNVSADGQTGTITGTTSAGAVFTLSIVLGSPNAVATYTQFTSLQGTEVIASGANMLTSGNGSDLLLTFAAGGGTTFNAVVTGVNYLDGTSTTINTSSKYIGASNNLMNPGERVTMDFASGTTGNAVASMKISFFSFDSAAATAPDELTIYGTTVDGTQFTYQITNASLDANGMYTIRAPGNELIRELVFEAGSQSSFKLGIESVSAVNDVPTFTVPLVYEITDASGDSDTGTISVTLGGLSGTSGNDTLNGGVNSDVMSGDAGNDTLNGGAGNDMINGGIGDDVIIGGAGNDTLTGGLGSDVFRWSLADAGTAGSPAIDSITDFDTSAGTDKLDLRDLLSGEVHSATSLDNYLHFEVTGGNTIVHISSTGGFGDDNVVSVGSAGVSSATETQQIVLVGVDLSAGNLTTDQQIIQSLINNQKLITD